MEKIENSQDAKDAKIENKKLPLGCIFLLNFWLFILFTLIYMGVAIKIDSSFEKSFISKALVPGFLTTAAFEFLREFFSRRRFLWLVPGLLAIALLTTWLIIIY